MDHVKYVNADVLDLRNHLSLQIVIALLAAICVSFVTYGNWRS